MRKIWRFRSQQAVADNTHPAMPEHFGRKNLDITALDCPTLL